MSTRKRASDPVDVATALDEVVDMLEESWKDLTRLRMYMGEYDLLSAVLQHYEGSVYIQNWYVADLLMGCRRLVDEGQDVVSIRRALIWLRKIADRVTVEEIAEHRRRRGTSNSSPADVDSSLHHWLSNRQPGDPIGKRAVQEDLNRISDVADRVAHLATHRVAHRLNKPTGKPAEVTRGEVAQLLSDLHDIYVRWSNVLRAVDVMVPEHQSMSPAMLRALELFDWHEYMEAVSEEARRLGPKLGSYEDVEAHARLEYRFDRGVESTD